MTVTEPTFCKAESRSGNRCKRRASSNGYCSVHDPVSGQDMRALGIEGGRQSVRSRLGLDPEVVDGRLRRKAKKRLEELLDSPDETKRLAAARSLYSYSPARAPKSEDEAPLSSLEDSGLAWLRRLDKLDEAAFHKALSEEAATLVCRIASRSQQVASAIERFQAGIETYARRQREMNGGEAA